MNGKNVLKFAGAILAGVAATATVLGERKSPTEPVRVTGYATYGMVIAALTRRKDISSYYKNQIMEAIPRDCDDPGLYSAAISVIEDSSMSSYYKNEAIEKLFKEPSD
jgi:hypothetical protein